jgi:hypothetical protein
MIEISNSISLSQDGYPVRQKYRFRYKHYEIGILLLWDTTTIIIRNDSKDYSVSAVCCLVDVKSAKAIAKKMIRRNWSLLNHGYEKTHGARESCLLG